MRTALVLGITMVLSTTACDKSAKKEDKAATKADAKADKKAEGKAKGDKKAEGADADIAIGKDGKAQPLGVPGM